MTLGIRTDKFRQVRDGRMTDEQLAELVDSETAGVHSKLLELHHQKLAALADGDIATAAHIVQLQDSLT